MFFQRCGLGVNPAGGWGTTLTIEMVQNGEGIENPERQKVVEI